MHGFCDASEEAYGACIYVRSKNNEQWRSQLLCSKSRVAPLKGATIPRLELGGALVLAKMALKVAASWDLEVKDFYLWTDSMVVLGWICSENLRWKTYVANRVEQILEITNAKQWRHVKTTENPADILSRGETSQELKVSEMWWNGPKWLVDSEDAWRESKKLLQEEESLPEKRTIKLVLTAVSQCNNLISRYSSWRRLVRATAWILKFVEYRRRKYTGVSCQRFLSVAELKVAENGLIRQAQSEEFGEDIHALQRGKEVPKRSRLKALCPLMRKDGVILVGGRLDYAHIAETQRHPIVLPARHKITKLVFEDMHILFLHCGPQALLAHVRQRYWPLKGRVMARSVTTRCVTCVKARPRFEVPLMAALPKDRVRISRPFTVTGVNFAGPLMIRSGIRRVTAIKAWIAVFVCFATRAIHLEAVVGLTSEAFIAALRRFMARRGKCAKIYSDNGTNFFGAQKEICKYLAASGDLMAREGIEWKFNPPSAPHFGGIWESAVKSTKIHLGRIVKDTRLTLEELQTLLCQIEACVNSRPMTPLGEDPSEPSALTPAHLLIGDSLLLLPEPDIPTEVIGHVRRWRFVQGLMQTFWKRWYREYLLQLQVRGRWLSSKREMVKNDIVIIKEDNTSPTKWKLGRVTQTHPGKDGMVRVVTVRTAAGMEIRRPVAKLCRLPVEIEDREVENN